MVERQPFTPDKFDTQKTILQRYAEAKNLVPTPGVSLFSNKNTAFTVVIPAFKEEARIGRTLQSLSANTSPIQVLVVDDYRSADATEDIVNNFADSDSFTSHYMRFPEPGRDRALTAGLDEVVIQHSSKEINKPHTLIFMDADTRAQPGWIEAIHASKQDADVVAGTFMYPTEFDTYIEAATGYKDFFRKFNTFTDTLLKHGAAPVRIVGSNTAIDLVHYAKIGGYTGLEGPKGELVPGTEDVFAEKLKQHNSRLSYCPVPTIVSPRRMLMSMIKKVDPISAYDGGSYVRENDEDLIQRACNTLTRDDFHGEILERLGMFFVNRVLNPAINAETNIEQLASLLEPNHAVVNFINERKNGELITPQEATYIVTTYLDEIIDILSKHNK